MIKAGVPYQELRPFRGGTWEWDKEVFAIQRVNELFGKEVVSQTSGEKQGTVRDIIFDEDASNIVALMVGGIVGRGRALRWTSVASVGDVVVLGGQGTLSKGRLASSEKTPR
jgi:sporulation protein YlmC with PRC-barrel domain